ncbi:glycoside hydrolase family 127 protein [Paenibacillus ferrarius]|uniref:glycoside hydrolase family 127 protein n=1 Tax=Paenibacillus ferrarius TaxID=1469647 RepID=UPI003D2AE73F
MSTVQSVKLGEAKLTEGFWANRVKDYMHVIRSMEKSLLNEGNAARLLNFGIAAGVIEGTFAINDWSDGDCYKFLEGCSNQYAVTKDPEILEIINRYIPWIEDSQESDGYINTQITLTSKERWKNPNAHELYNLGHLFTAACVHYEATEDSRLLEVAKRAADYLCKVFIPLNKELGDFCFNPSQIMGLVELYRLTDERRYLELADIFVTMRGTKLGNGDQNQNRVPLREETKPVGHAVTASYLYAGAADVYAHTKEEALLTALERIWNDMISKRIYITGGVCPYYEGVSERGDRIQEAFGDEYNLPNRISYNETCANIAAAMWAHRMLHITNKPVYGDWMENILFNAGISGGSLDMTRYFYANPLSHRAKEHLTPTFRQYAHAPNERFVTFGCWCCPPQLWRTMTGLPRWIYSLSENGVRINLFAGCDLDSQLPSGEPVKVSMSTSYPWDEEVKIRMDAAPAEGMELQIRIPAWCPNATLNGRTVESGHHSIPVRAGDELTIILPMQATLYQANPMVEQANGMLAVKRGPVVYCLEGCDIASDDVTIDELALPTDAVFTEATMEDMLYGIIGLHTELIYRPKGNALYHPLLKDSEQRVAVRMIPYFTWANRKESDMSVWLPRA